MTWSRCPGVNCLFVRVPGEQRHVTDLGEYVSLPVDVVSILARGEESLRGRPAQALPAATDSNSR